MDIEQKNTDNSITFIDTEVDFKSGKIFDIGSIKDNNSTFHNHSLSEFMEFLKGSKFLCGHNILNHDIKYIGKALKKDIKTDNIIDTLFLSPFFFQQNPTTNY